MLFLLILHFTTHTHFSSNMLACTNTHARMHTHLSLELEFQLAENRVSACVPGVQWREHHGVTTSDHSLLLVVDMTVCVVYVS